MAEAQNTRANAQQIEEDLAHGGTEATNYVGGGGYLKRAWDLLKRPLNQAKAAANALPPDMQGDTGEIAIGAAANARAWRSKWQPATS